MIIWRFAKVRVLLVKMVQRMDDLNCLGLSLFDFVARCSGRHY